MAWQKGQSGNPLGKAHGKPWTDAIRIELASLGGAEGVTGGLRAIARGVIAAATGGDQAAYKEIGDRLEGKPMQNITQTIRDARSASDAELIAVIDESERGEGVALSSQNPPLTH